VQTSLYDVAFLKRSSQNTKLTGIIVFDNKMMTIDNPLHRMMSQGISVVVAKLLLEIESKYDNKVAVLESAWNKKLSIAKSDFDEIIRNQNEKIQSMTIELSTIKEMMCNCECFSDPSHQNVSKLTKDIAATRETMDVTYDEINTNVLSLAIHVEKIKNSVARQETVTSTIQSSIDDFLRLYDNRNDVVDIVITQHENDLKTARVAIGGIDRQTEAISRDVIKVKHMLEQNMRVLQEKLELHIESSTEREDMLVSVDEHNRLRLNLEDQIMECNTKYDHILMSVQQQLEQNKHRSEELEVVKGVVARAKNRREFALKEIKMKHHMLAQIMEHENECKTDEIIDYLVLNDHACKDSKVHRDNANASENKHFSVEMKESEYIHKRETISRYTEVIHPCVGGNIRFENEDNDSEFGNSINLVLLDEISIH
jgi:hypothetical protein